MSKFGPHRDIRAHIRAKTLKKRAVMVAIGAGMQLHWAHHSRQYAQVHSGDFGFEFWQFLLCGNGLPAD